MGDWWSLGVCMFEFATGIPPFNDETAQQVLENIIACDIPWPTGEETLHENIVEPIKALLVADPLQRAEFESLKKLPLFDCVVDWDDMCGRQEPPFVPTPSDPSDTDYFKPKNEARNIQMTV